jgi:hypothetical protein
MQVNNKKIGISGCGVHCNGSGDVSVCFCENSNERFEFFQSRELIYFLCESLGFQALR